MNGRKELPSRSFSSYFPHAVTEGGRGVCVVQTCTGCVVSLQNRTRRHDVPHVAEQTAAPMCISALCRSSTVNSPPAGGIGVRVLPASAVLISNGDACARRRGLRCFETTFYAAHQKSSLIRFVAPPFQNANISLVCILVFLPMLENSRTPCLFVHFTKGRVSVFDIQKDLRRSLHALSAAQPRPPPLLGLLPLCRNECLTATANTPDSTDLEKNVWYVNR